MKVDSNISAPTKFVQVGNESYAYRRLGNGGGLPLLFLQHFPGTKSAAGGCQSATRTGPDWYAAYMAAEQSGAEPPR